MRTGLQHRTFDREAQTPAVRGTGVIGSAVVVLNPVGREVLRTRNVLRARLRLCRVAARVYKTSARHGGRYERDNRSIAWG